MKKFFTLLLLFCVLQTYAEKLIFQNNNEQVDITGFASINNQTGDITVVTVGEHQIINVDNQPVILGFYPSDYDVEIGTNITVNWSVAFADSCVASTTSGVVAWSGNKESNNGNWSQASVNVSQLPATLQLECENAGNGSTTRSFILNEQTTGVITDPAFSSFTVNSQSNSVTVSGAAAVAWSTTDISSCTASASPAVSGWSGSKNVSGSQNVTFTQDTTISLTCDGIERSVNVIFSNNTNCPAMPSGLTRVNQPYSSFNDGFNFGESTNASFELQLRETEFATLSNFSYEVANERKRLVFTDAPPSLGIMGAATISISECPGDFTSAALCVMEVNNASTVRITTRPQDSTGGLVCKVVPGESYYINYIMSPAPYTSPPNCAAPINGRCTVFYAESF